MAGERGEVGRKLSREKKGPAAAMATGQCVFDSRQQQGMGWPAEEDEIIDRCYTWEISRGVSSGC